MDIPEEQAHRILKKLLSRYNEVEYSAPSDYVDWDLRQSIDDSKVWYVQIIDSSSNKRIFIDKYSKFIKICSKDKPGYSYLLNYLISNKHRIITDLYPNDGIIRKTDTLEKLLIEDDLDN